MRNGRWLWVMAVCFLAALPPARGAAPPRVWTAEQRAKLKERDRLAAEVVRLWTAGQRAEALAAWQKKLAIEREVFGSVHEEVARSLGALARFHELREDFRAMRDARAEALAVYIKLYGAEDWRVTDARLHLEDVRRRARLTAGQRRQLWQAEALNGQVLRLLQEGRPKEALPLAKKVLAIRQELLGEGHRLVAMSVFNLGVVHEGLNEFREAERLYRQARGLYKEVLGERHPHYVFSLTKLAMLYADKGEYARARVLYERALPLYKGLVGEHHPGYAELLRSAGMLYQHMGDYPRARPLLEQARDICEGARGERPLDYANSLDNLVLLYHAMGDYARARPLLEQALALTREARGERHPDYARSLNNLASLYHAMGEYARAKALFEQARDLCGTTLGKRHRHYATSLNNLGRVYKDVGDYPRAQELYERALDIYEAALGERHPDYAQSLNNLAGLYRDMGDHARARALLERVRTLRKGSLGERHPDYATTLSGLALLYLHTREHGRARALLERARGVYKESLGEKHPLYANSLRNLAVTYQEAGDYPNALKLFLQARDIFLAALGERHPDYADSLYRLARLSLARGEGTKAEELARRALLLFRGHLEDTFTALGDRQRLDFLRRQRDALDLYLAVTVGARTPARKLYGEVLGWKGAVTARAAEERLAAERPQLRPLAQRLREARAGLAKLTANPPGTEVQQKDWLKRFRELEKQKEELEAVLAGKSADYRRFLQLRQAGARAVSRALPAGAVLVDFLVYAHATPPGKAKGEWRFEERLLAFVLARGREPACVPLGAHEPIAKAVRGWSRAVGEGKDPAAFADELARRVWRPLGGHLKGARAVLLAPDGALCALAFAALPGREEGSFVLEEVAVGYLASGRQLLELDADTDRPEAEGLLALGGLDYGRGGKPAEGELRIGVRSATWAELPGTRLEARRVASAYRAAFPRRRPPLLLGGRDGDANRLRRELGVVGKGGRWRFLHLATHGFFDPPLAAPAPARGAGALLPFEHERGRLTFWRNPLLSCGLVLAGANADPDAGSLSGEEVANLDLRGCELVVLSACQTGLGRVDPGEGMQGLQRAFHAGGARATAVSLWGVSDAATSVLMEEFYANLWGEDKLSKLEALRRAQLAVLRHPEKVRRRAAELRAELVKRGLPEEQLAARGLGKKAADLPAGGKDRGRRSPPAWWAGFVLYGHGW